jgi:hypothetical protein
MPGSFTGTDEEWQALEAPFLQIDPKLNIYALANGLDLLKNRSGRPDRALEWYSDGMERRATIVAEGGTPPRFAVHATASRKFDGDGPVAERRVGDDLELEQVRADFIVVFEEAMSEANRIPRDDVGGGTST